MKTILKILAIAWIVQGANAQTTNLTIPPQQGPTLSEGDPTVAEEMRQKGVEDGRSQASAEIKKGNLVIVALRRDSLRPEDRYLETKYGIQTFFLKPTRGTWHILGWVEGYNSTMIELFKTRFGTDVFKEAKRAVQEERTKKAQHKSGP